MSDSTKVAASFRRWAARMIDALRRPATGDGDARDLEERVFQPREIWHGASAIRPETRSGANPRKIDA